MTRMLILCVLAFSAFGQLPPTVSQPTNLDFSAGEIGQLPPGWNMPPGVLGAGYRAELRDLDCGARFLRCVAYVAPVAIGTVRAAELSQTFPAAAYIGKSIRFSAWLRLQEAKDGGYVHIRMRVDYADGGVTMLDSTAPPVKTSEWQRRQVNGHVGPGAVSITIWTRYVPSGYAWVAEPSFEGIEDVPGSRLTSFGVATASFPVKVAVGQMVRYSGWIKTENVSKGYAGLWWRVDGAKSQVLAFDNSRARVIDGLPASGNGVIRGATGTTGWGWYQVELPVPVGASNINFGLLLDGNGTAWFDSLRVELNGVAYTNPQFDFDFESPTLKGFPFAGDNMNRGWYRVGIDKTTALSGRQSLRMHFVGDRDEAEAPPRLTGVAKALDPSVVDKAARSVKHSTPASLNFVNHSGTAVDIYWIDYDGNRILYRSGLAVDSNWQIGTYLTHPWLVVVSGSGGTTQHDTGIRLTAFEASNPGGGDAIITDKR